MGHLGMSAIDVADDLLQRTGMAMLTGDTDGFVCCFSLPQVFQTALGQVHVETRNQLARMFETVHGQFRSLGVTDMARHVLHAEFRDPETIYSTHETRLLHGHTLLQEPFPVFSVLKAFGSRWLIRSSAYGARDDSLAGRAYNAALTLDEGQA